jgi:hypothetical protein
VSEASRDESKPADRPTQPPATDEHKPLS